MTIAQDTRFWDRAAEKYARAALADPAGYERTLTRTAALLAPDARVLELGCGTASTALRLAGGVGSYLATDLSPAMIAIGQRKLAASPQPRLTLRVATAETLATEPDRFDAVLAFSYLHLVHDPAAVLRAVHGVLAPGGLFISKTPCLREMNPLIPHVALPVMRLIGKAPHVELFDGPALERMIRAAGFTVVATERHATRGRDTRPFIVARRG